MEKDIPLGRIARPDDIVKVIAFLASKRSEKITGQVIKVDGGRSLTSSGYVHYRGMKNMNSRFEPDRQKFTTWLGDMFSSKQKMDKLIQNEAELKQFVEENINQSNFSTRLTDAHKNVNASYKIVDANEDLLKDRYLKGNSPNILLEKKGNRQGKMSYNEGLFPIQQFPETKGSLMYSPVNNKVEEENINNINNINNENDFGYDENDFNVEDNNENENEGMKENNRY